MSGEQRSTTAHKRGMAPGTVVHVGHKRTHKPEILLTRYNEHLLVEKHPSDAVEATKQTKAKGVQWIHVTGLHDTKILEQIGTAFNLHPLLLEDVANTEQRPKIEVYEDTLFLVGKYLHADKTTVLTDHVSIILQGNVVITFQEGEDDIFTSIRERIKAKKRIVKKDADYLVYALLDTIVDQYFTVIDTVTQRVDKLEHDVLKDAVPSIVNEIQKLKRDQVAIRKAAWPMRDVLNSILRDGDQFKKGTLVYMRDVGDHIVQIIEAEQTLRDTSSSLLDLYMSTQSNKMNEVMKVLTVISTVFIPLTFITGIYGMNFVNMPELLTRNGYFVVLTVMGVIGFFLFWWFGKKGWLRA